MGPLNDSGLLNNALHGSNNFEIDSKATNSTMLPAISSLIKDNSLLKKGTWAYLGSGSDTTRRYLFWTSVDVNTVEIGTKIPVIIIRADGKYYISESTTAQRTGDKIKEPYMTIAEHQLNSKSYQNIANKGTQYDTLQDAYDAYVKKITEESKYSEFKDTLPQN